MTNKEIKEQTDLIMKKYRRLQSTFIKIGPSGAIELYNSLATSDEEIRKEIKEILKSERFIEGNGVSKDCFLYTVPDLPSEASINKIATVLNLGEKPLIGTAVLHTVPWISDTEVRNLVIRILRLKRAFQQISGTLN